MSEDRLTQILEQLSNKPYDYNLHLQHIEAAKAAEDRDSLFAARELFSQFFPLSPALWLEWINDQLKDASTLDGIVQLVSLFARAEDDVLSVDICYQHALWALKSYCGCRGWPSPTDDNEDEMGDATQVDESLQEIWSDHMTRQQLKAASNRATQHLSQGHKVWQLWEEFEKLLLDKAPDDQKAEQKTKLQTLYILRLSDPHTQIQSTFSSYSTFVSNHIAATDSAYEEQMVEANAIYAPSKANVERRESKEAELRTAQYSTEAYLSYVSYERTGKKANSDDSFKLAADILERAIADHPFDWAIWEAYLQLGRDRLSSAMQSENDDASVDALEASKLVAEKACRYKPDVSDSWIALMRLYERDGSNDEVEATFAKALNTGLLSDKVDDVVKLYIARADFHRRLFEDALEEEAEETPAVLKDVLEVIVEGTVAVKSAKKSGDPSFRLERYLTRFLERFGRLDEGVAVWKKACDMYKYHSMAWMGFAELHVRRNDVEAARQVYRQAAKNRFDYPEYLFDAWTTFEHYHGTIGELEETENEVKRQMKNLNARRARLAAQAAQQHPAQLEKDTDEEQSKSQTNAKEPKSSLKRPAEDAASEDGAAGPDSKKAKISHEPSANLKRDRENSTVLVGGFPPDATENDLRKTFQDCGIIREVDVYVRPDQTYATIEFYDRESVLPALTKDKKRIQGVEIAVEKAWQSTLFVSNFPESFDDEQLKKLFSKYGVILSLRRPSKRYKSSRRFVYIQYATAAAAKASLELHDKEVDGFKMSVEISDPQRKKERSDAHANEKEVYVNGLARSVTEEDLRKLFGQFGKITGLRLPIDEATQTCRGFAFVDFETEEAARAALALNSTELKKRNMSVTIADSRQAGTKKGSKQAESAVERSAARARSVRVTNLLPDTQEAQLEQLFSQTEKVAKVIVNAERQTATIEFEDEAAAGRVLLLPQGKFKLGKHELALTAMKDAAPIAQQQAQSPKTSVGDGSLRPRVFNKRGRGRGSRGGFAKR